MLIVAGVLIFSIDWSVGSLATFIGALFIFEGIYAMFVAGIDNRVANLVMGLLSVVAGVVIIAWPGPSLIVLGIFLGVWLIVIGTITISGAFAASTVMSDWWLLLLIGLAEVPLGVLALANPGATLAAIITVGGIWAVVIGATRIVLAFQLRKLPKDVDSAWADAKRQRRIGRRQAESTRANGSLVELNGHRPAPMNLPQPRTPADALPPASARPRLTGFWFPHRS